MVPEVSWHRGGSEAAPSASREAFVDAARSGAEDIEVDVRRCADGTLVCVHDASLAGLGAVSDLRPGPSGLDGRILTLERFLDDLDEHDPGRTSRVHFDLKATGYELEAVDALIARGRRYFATTSELASIRLLRESRPREEAWLTIGRSFRGGGVVRGVRTLYEDLFPFARIEESLATGVALHQRLATTRVLRWCRRHGIHVAVWTVDDDQALRRWLASDIDVVTTNRPRRALALRAELALGYIPPDEEAT